MPGNSPQSFFESFSFALFGLSRSRRNFAWSIYRALVDSGKQVYAVRPDGIQAHGIQTFPSLDALPRNPDAAIVCHRLQDPTSFLATIAKSGVKNVWFQQGSCKKDALKRAEQPGLKLQYGCVLMYLPGSSFPHRLHRFFHYLFRKGKV